MRTLSFFASDVHLGLDVGDPGDRERRFVNFLRSIPAERTENLFLLGDIFDFWYEYRDVVPKGYTRVFAALQDLMEAGVKVFFFEGNHDVWSYSYFEELGMVKLSQPALVRLGDKVFCLGHGDGLGPVPCGYRFLSGIFHCRFLQMLFSSLHPWIAFRFGRNWSRHNRLSRGVEYEFKGPEEPLYKFAEDFASRTHVDCFIFGHYHAAADVVLPGGSRLLLLKDWIKSSPYFFFDAERGEVELS